MRTDSFVVLGLLVGIAVLLIGTLVTLATTTLADTQSIATVVVLLLTVLAASALGTWARKRPRTAYW